jgi:hemoglobin
MGAEETAAARADTGAEETAAARADTGAEETAAALPDIATREDCAALVRAFYTRALADEVIGFIFTDVAQLDLEHHLPRITRFWETVLLGAGTYGGGAFRPHLELNQQVPLRRGHFERWLWLWQGTVDALYAGPVADAAKRHAARVATAFSGRIEAINAGRLDPGPDVASPPGRAGAAAPRLTVTQVRAPRRPG